MLNGDCNDKYLVPLLISLRCMEEVHGLDPVVYLIRMMWGWNTGSTFT